MNDCASETAIASGAGDGFRAHVIITINGFAFMVAIHGFYIFKVGMQLIEFTSVLAYGWRVCPLTIEASVSLGAYKGKWFRTSVSYLFCRSYAVVKGEFDEGWFNTFYPSVFHC